jgi:hypothetical protein
MPLLSGPARRKRRSSTTIDTLTIDTSQYRGRPHTSVNLKHPSPWFAWVGLSSHLVAGNARQVHRNDMPDDFV